MTINYSNRALGSNSLKDSSKTILASGLNFHVTQESHIFVRENAVLCFMLAEKKSSFTGEEERFSRKFFPHFLA